MEGKPRRKRGPYKAYLHQDSSNDIPPRSKYFYSRKTQDKAVELPPLPGTPGGNSSESGLLSKNDTPTASWRSTARSPSPEDEMVGNAVNADTSGQAADGSTAFTGSTSSHACGPVVACGKAPVILNRAEVEVECLSDTSESNASIDDESCNSSSGLSSFLPCPYEKTDDCLPSRTPSRDSQNDEEEMEFVNDAEEMTLDEYVSDNEDFSQNNEDGRRPDYNGSDFGDLQQPDDLLEQCEENCDKADQEQQEDVAHNVLHHAQITHKKLRKLAGQDSFTSPISIPVCASPAEALLMILRMAKVNHLTFKAFADSAKLINSLFLSPVIPQTSYLLDEILVYSKEIERYFYCAKCFYSFGNVNHNENPVLVCPQQECKHHNDVKDLTKVTYFTLFSIPAQIQLLFMNKNIRDQLVIPKDIVMKHADGKMTDIYDGQCYRRFVNSLPQNCTEQIISFTFSTDGSPLFKSSNFSIWPFFLYINELPPVCRMRNLILGGLWFGNRHPPMDLFLDPIANHLRSLSEDGFIVRVEEKEVAMRAYGIGCCVDSGARGAVQGLNSHSGYYSCNWCETSGQYVDKVVFPFQEVQPKLRSHEDIVKYAEECVNDGNLAHVYGVQYLSPLHKLPKFDLVKGMVLDFAHNVPFGIARTFLQDWLSNTARSSYIGSPRDIKYLDKMMFQLTPPLEVRRRPRKISESTHWNAREYENWTLIYSLPVLEGVLPSKYLRNWSYLVQAIHLLSRVPLSNDNIDHAHRLLLHFCAEVECLYGETFMTYNLHILGHLAENVARWGPIFTVSTYCFENGIKDMKALLHAQRGVPHQIHRALSYRQAEQILEGLCETPRTEIFGANIAPKTNKMTRYLPVKQCVLVGSSTTLEANAEEMFLLQHSGFNKDVHNCSVWKKIIRARCVYTSCDMPAGKLRNCEALTTAGDIVSIKKFILDIASERVYLFCVNIYTSTFLRMPQDISLSAQDHCIRNISAEGRRVKVFSVEDLETVCVKTELNGKAYVTVFPNTYNVF